MKHLRSAIVILGLFSFTSCATYYQKNIEFQRYFTSGDMEKAYKYLEKDEKSAKGKAKVLYYMNKGVVAHMLGDYSLSNTYLLVADRLVEDYQKNYGLEILSFVTNPLLTEYQAEDFESVMIHYYLALNYIQLGNYEDAIVECKRINNRLNYINDNRKQRITYRQDAFALNLMGMIFEADGQVNDAFIAYRNAYETYQGDYAKDYGLSAPEQLKQDLLRTAYLNGFMDELRQYEQAFGRKYLPETQKDSGSVVFLWNNGLGPVKAELALTFTVIPGTGGAVTFKNDELGWVFPFPAYNLGAEDKQNLGNLRMVRIVLPKFVERIPLFEKGIVKAGGKTYTLEKVQDVNAIAFQNLEDRMLRELGEALLRVALKQAAAEAVRKKNEGLGAALNVIGALSEQADTRNWQTLPHDIYYSRINLPPGEHQLQLETSGNGSTDVHYLNVKVLKGKTTFISFSSLEAISQPAQGFWQP
ncbi:MAG: hypothetical protein SFW35_02090 [Chitinophagales bacterium]|nr:hypothetical protein [Chitinophagales bacterium]